MTNLFKKIRQTYRKECLNNITEGAEEVLPKLAYALVYASAFGKIRDTPVTREEVEESLTQVISLYRTCRQKCLEVGLDVSDYDSRIAAATSKLNYVPFTQ